MQLIQSCPIKVGGLSPCINQLMDKNIHSDMYSTVMTHPRDFLVFFPYLLLAPLSMSWCFVIVADVSICWLVIQPKNKSGLGNSGTHGVCCGCAHTLSAMLRPMGEYGCLMMLLLSGMHMMQSRLLIRQNQTSWP